jgi:phospholipid/cholesterol/gamma-HCH transport system substrate-binding protein
MNDRFLGYIILSVLSILILTPCTYLIWKTQRPVEKRVISFTPINSLSFLNVQDPVRVRGLESGAVSRVFNKDQKVFVEIEATKPLEIHSGYKIIVTVKGILGDRYIEIDPGDPEKEIVSKDEVLEGQIMIGPAEAVAGVEKLCEAVDKFSRLTMEFKNGTENMPSFVNRFKNVTLAFDSISGSVLEVAERIDSDLGKSLDSLGNLLSETSELSKKLSGTVPQKLDELDRIVVKAGEFAVKIDTLINQAEKLTEKLNSPELKELEVFITESRKNLNSLRKAIIEIRDDGLRLPVRVRFR